MNIVFDFGGVVFDWHPPTLLRSALPERCADDAAIAALRRQVFHSEWADFDRGALEMAALVERIAARSGLPAADVQRIVDGVPAHLQPKADTVALIERLHAEGHALYYLSNMPAPYAVMLEREHGFLRRFTDGVFSGRVGRMKPGAEIYALASGRFGHAPADLVFIDDMAANVAAARSLGWQALLFSGAAQVERELRAGDLTVRR